MGAWSLIGASECTSATLLWQLQRSGLGKMLSPPGEKKRGGETSSAFGYSLLDIWMRHPVRVTCFLLHLHAGLSESRTVCRVLSTPQTFLLWLQPKWWQSSKAEKTFLFSFSLCSFQSPWEEIRASWFVQRCLRAYFYVINVLSYLSFKHTSSMPVNVWWTRIDTAGPGGHSASPSTQRSCCK